MPRASEKAVPEKLGRQTPTAAVVLPYTTTHGQYAYYFRHSISP